jgi:ubiquitin-conjugating enzyme E2 Z
MSNKKISTNSLGPNKKRLLKDVVDIMKHPLTSEGINYFHDESNFQKGYAFIFGPKDTLYENGIYFFEFSFPNDYPFSPPKLKYLTNNGKTRFNPNLYRSGKVCISILNTWKGEQWTSCQTIRSILLTLLTLLHNKPLLNEPGITEKHRDFINYNKIIRYRNYETAIMRVADRKLLPDPFVSTFHIIKKHLINNKDQILKDIFEKIKTDDEKSVGEVVNCGIYKMSCRINYAKLYEKMKIVLSEYN